MRILHNKISCRFHNFTQQASRWCLLQTNPTMRILLLRWRVAPRVLGSIWMMWDDVACPKSREYNMAGYVGFVEVPDLGTSYICEDDILTISGGKNEGNQLRWRSYPMIQGFLHHRCCRISVINSMMLCCTTWATSTTRDRSGTKTIH